MGLKEIVVAALNQIPLTELQKLKQSNPGNERDADRLLESWLGIWKQFNLYHQTLIPLFDQYDLLCYHATRVWNRPVFAPVDERPTGAFDFDSNLSTPFPKATDRPKGGLLLLADLKGIEPSNLTDANRALSRIGRLLAYSMRRGLFC